jgi:hypothetical protein
MSFLLQLSPTPSYYYYSDFAFPCRNSYEPLRVYVCVCVCWRLLSYWQLLFVFGSFMNTSSGRHSLSFMNTFTFFFILTSDPFPLLARGPSFVNTPGD